MDNYTELQQQRNQYQKSFVSAKRRGDDTLALDTNKEIKRLNKLLRKIHKAKYNS